MTKHTPVSARSKTAVSLTLKPLVSAILAWIHRPVSLTLAFGAMPMVAFAQMPTGGEVIAGSATISAPDAAHTVISQGTDKAVINWQSFSIGKDGYVQFVQPGAGSVTLNRVVGVDPSQILGHLSANGQLFLVNPNGVFFSSSAVVDVAGIVATTLDINNDDFMRGDYRFSRSTQAAQGASVINEGSITAKNGGYVVLAGDYAANKGIVQAQLGTALLASGDALTLQTAGSGLVSYQVDKATVARLAGVENSGQILANGGRVIMTADVANDLAATVVNNSGLVQAQSLVEKEGAVYFEGQGGSVANSGTIDASAQAGAHGGKVDIRASGDITHQAGSVINVSGASTGTSDAGTVYTWADGTNHFKKDASIVARGGAQGGNGGQVELSGNKVVNRSIVDLRAPNGSIGTLTLDPTAITIASGAGLDAGDLSTIYEQNLELQLQNGSVVLAATGANASITLADLADGVLDGTSNGAGGSLTLTASGGGTPSIVFANTANTIKVDGGLSLAVDNGAGSNAVGSIAVGNLQAGTAINLKAGSVSAGNLSVAKTISSGTNSSYSINARAYAGNLSLGNVTVDVTNTVAAGVNSSVTLRADGGNVTAGNVSSKATGLGYYNYDWSTAGNAAPTYLGAQPWTLDAQGDHAIAATLVISATVDVTTGALDVSAIDTNTVFGLNPTLGGYWQTQTATQHNFWRPTAASASAQVNAGGDVTINGKTSVVADGYAMNSYSETESWRTMVDNFNYTGGSQTVTGTTVDGNGNTVPTSTTNNYNNVKGSIKGAGGTRYIWEFGQYTVINGSTVANSPNVNTLTDTNTGTTTTTRYTGLSGLSSTLDVNANGSVTMDGMDVRSVNHSSSGSGSYTDVNWGRQDTENGLNSTGSGFTSANQETDYEDAFGTNYTAAASTSTATITAGGAVSLGGASSYDVIGGYPASSVPGAASMTVTAHNGPLTIGSNINVIGSSLADVALTLRADTGDINAANTNAVVKNGYGSADGRATVSTGTGNIHLGGLAVSGEGSAYVNVNSAGTLAIDGATSATSLSASNNGVAAANISLASVGNLTVGDVIASSVYFVNNRVSGYYDAGHGLGYDYRVYGGTSNVDVRSSTGNVALNGDVKASGYETANVYVGATAPGRTLTSADGKTVSATAVGQTFTSSSFARYLRVPTYSATTTLASDGAMSLGSSVGATVTNGNGAALVNITTNGGPTASISQGAGSLIKASGSTGTVNVNAGAASPTVNNAATLNMLGAIVGAGSTGAGVVNVKGSSGTVSGLGASSSGDTASVGVVALDSNGVLVLGGNGTITGNANNASGALLIVNALGALDASAATIALTNSNTGTDAGAFASLGAGNGYNRVGSIGVTGFHTAVLSATAPGAVTAAGAAYTTATAASGHAESNLASSTAGVGIESGSSLSATANLGTADVLLTGITGATLNGNATATAANGTATVAVTTTGGNTAAITQGANSTLLASGATSLVSLNAGDATPGVSNAATYNLLGDVQARSLAGTTGIAITGKAGAVHNFSVEGGVATADITALDGALDLTGNGSVTGLSVGTVNATSTGNLSTRDVIHAAVANPGSTAQVNLTSSNGALLVDTASDVEATSSAGKADVNLTGATGLTVNGNVTAQSVNNDATVDLLTTGGTTATVAQGANSTVLAQGNHSVLTLNAGNAVPTSANAAAVNLAGNLVSQANAGTAQILVKAASGTVHNVSAESTSNGATVDLATLAASAGLVLNGLASASGNVDNAAGGLLKATSAGSLNTGAATLVARNLSTGANAGAKVNLAANGGSATLGLTSVSVQGGGVASLLAKAASNLTANGNLNALSQGTSGSALIDVTAINGAVAVNGPANANVLSGAGNATVNVRGGSTATVGNVRVAANGTGNALLNVGAPSEIVLNGPLDVTAANAAKRADIKLVADRLTDHAPTIRLSTGNGHVQLASFSTGNIIGVNSARDFDAAVQTNYTLTTLNKLLNQQAEVTFGGEYDRSAWTPGTLPVQQTGNIHVAGDSNINLVGVKMVFDTTGTTFYHDSQMSSWNVPNGRVATYVPRPVTNYDRYLDRTDYSVQNLNRVTDASFNNAGNSAANAAPAGSQLIAGNLFMNGDGVNMVRNAVRTDATPQGKDGASSLESQGCTGTNADGTLCGF